MATIDILKKHLGDDAIHKEGETLFIGGGNEAQVFDTDIAKQLADSFGKSTTYRDNRAVQDRPIPNQDGMSLVVITNPDELSVDQFEAGKKALEEAREAQSKRDTERAHKLEQANAKIEGALSSEPRTSADSHTILSDGFKDEAHARQAVKAFNDHSRTATESHNNSVTYSADIATVSKDKDGEWKVDIDAKRLAKVPGPQQDVALSLLAKDLKQGRANEAQEQALQESRIAAIEAATGAKVSRGDNGSLTIEREFATEHEARMLERALESKQGTFDKDTIATVKDDAKGIFKVRLENLNGVVEPAIKNAATVIKAMDAREEKLAATINPQKSSDGITYIGQGFDTKEAAEEISRKLDTTRSSGKESHITEHNSQVVLTDNGKYYVRIDDVAKISDHQMNAVASKIPELVQKEADDRIKYDTLAGKLGKTIEEPIERKGDTRDYRVKEGFTHRDNADKLINALNEQIPGIASIAPKQEDGKFIVQIDETRLEGNAIGTLKTGTLDAVASARKTQRGYDAAATKLAEKEKAETPKAEAAVAAEPADRNDRVSIVYDRPKSDAVKAEPAVQAAAATPEEAKRSTPIDFDKMINDSVKAFTAAGTIGTFAASPAKMPDGLDAFTSQKEMPDGLDAFVSKPAASAAATQAAPKVTDEPSPLPEKSGIASKIRTGLENLRKAESAAADTSADAAYAKAGNREKTHFDANAYALPKEAHGGLSFNLVQEGKTAHYVGAGQVGKEGLKVYKSTQDVVFDAKATLQDGAKLDVRTLKQDNIPGARDTDGKIGVMLEKDDKLSFKQEGNTVTLTITDKANHAKNVTIEGANLEDITIGKKGAKVKGPNGEMLDSHQGMVALKDVQDSQAKEAAKHGALAIDATMTKRDLALAALDGNGDGKLSAEEVRKLDANGNGKVSAKDIEAWAKANSMDAKTGKDVAAALGIKDQAAVRDIATSLRDKMVIPMDVTEFSGPGAGGGKGPQAGGRAA